MKSYGGLFEVIVSEDNLRAAMKRAARGKHDRGSVGRFLERAADELQRLHSELTSGDYRPGAFDQFRILDPKPRRISCAPFRDRVVHHAVCCHLGPLIERGMIYHSYACRRGKGTHRAVLQAQRNSRCRQYFLQADIRSFFDSVDHDVLLAVLCRKFRDRRLRALLERIVRHPLPGQAPGKGLPIGNLTSQWFANLYLNELDHLACEQWPTRAYVRYMDDVVFWADSKDALWEVTDRLRDYLAARRCLQIKDGSLLLAPVTEGIPFLGMRVYPALLRFQHQRLRRMRRLIRQREDEYLAGERSRDELAACVGASIGLASFFGITGLVNSDLDDSV